jgi:hypothetical protein
MKTFGKNLLPEIHVNPINRDLIIVLFTGLLLALAVGTATAFLLIQL